MYEDEFELTFDTPEEEPVYEPEKASAAPAPVPETTPAEIVPDEPTRVLEPRSAAPAEPAEPTPVSEPEPAEEPQPQSAAVPANGRTVLISGGDRGIGAAAARAFYAAGYRVAVLYHSNAEAAAALEAELPGITAVQCDVASRASCELAFRAAEQALGRVDVLVSNAGIAQQKLFTDITPEEWQHMLDVNLTGAFHLCQLALPQGGPHPDGEQHVGPDRRQLRSALFCRQSGSHRPDQGTGQRRRPQRHHGELCGTRGH